MSILMACECMKNVRRHLTQTGGRDAAIRGMDTSPENEYDGAALMWYSSLSACEKAMSMPSKAAREAGRMLLKDERVFIDLPRCAMMYVPILPAPPPSLPVAGANSLHVYYPFSLLSINLRVCETRHRWGNENKGVTSSALLSTLSMEGPHVTFPLKRLVCCSFLLGNLRCVMRLLFKASSFTVVRRNPTSIVMSRSTHVGRTIMVPDLGSSCVQNHSDGKRGGVIQFQRGEFNFFYVFQTHFAKHILVWSCQDPSSMPLLLTGVGCAMSSTIVYVSLFAQ
jgi:hypothetical protein